MNIFNEGLIDTELFWLSFGDIISNMVIATVIIAEIGFVIWLLLKWLRGNVKFNWSPSFHVGESARSRTDSPIFTVGDQLIFTFPRNHFNNNQMTKPISAMITVEITIFEITSPKLNQKSSVSIRPSLKIITYQ